MSFTQQTVQGRCLERRYQEQCKRESSQTSQVKSAQRKQNQGQKANATRTPEALNGKKKLFTKKGRVITELKIR